MNEREYIVGAERDAYIRDFEKVMMFTVKQVIGMADKHNMDKDNVMDHFATVFKTMQEVSTFQHFGEGE